PRHAQAAGGPRRPRGARRLLPPLHPVAGLAAGGAGRARDAARGPRGPGPHHQGAEHRGRDGGAGPGHAGALPREHPGRAAGAAGHRRAGRGEPDHAAGPAPGEAAHRAAHGQDDHPGRDLQVPGPAADHRGRHEREGPLRGAAARKGTGAGGEEAAGGGPLLGPPGSCAGLCGLGAEHGRPLRAAVPQRQLLERPRHEQRDARQGAVLRHSEDGRLCHRGRLLAARREPVLAAPEPAPRELPAHQGGARRRALPQHLQGDRQGNLREAHDRGQLRDRPPPAVRAEGGRPRGAGPRAAAGRLPGEVQGQERVPGLLHGRLAAHAAALRRPAGGLRPPPRAAAAAAPRA
ncbi:unnamed protein product, partial [Heterosigma akashiwo]